MSLLWMIMGTGLALVGPPSAASEGPAASEETTAAPEADAAAGIAAAMRSRSHVPPRTEPEPPPTGKGLLFGGIALTLIGVPLTAAVARGFFPLSQQSHDFPAGSTLGIPLLFPGVACLAGGVAMIAVGGVRLARWRRWQLRQERELRLNAGRSPSGAWTLGVALRF